LNADRSAPFTELASSVFLLPYGGDLVAACAERIIANQQNRLPDLTNCVVLLADPQPAATLRATLQRGAAKLGMHALLGPRITTLSAWIEASTVPAARRCPEKARELILVEALRQHGPLFGDRNPWVISESLLTLFDELTRHRVSLGEDEDRFRARLGEAYGLSDRDLEALSREARLIHTLWIAWHRQHHEEGSLDPPAAYIDALQANRASHRPNPHFYIVGPTTLLPAEAAWIRGLLDAGQVTVFLQGGLDARVSETDQHPDSVPHRLLRQLDLAQLDLTQFALDRRGDKFSQFIDAVFVPLPTAVRGGDPIHDRPPVDGVADLRQRAAAFAAAIPSSPAAGRIHVFRARSAESEARAIDIQIRRWLLAGHRRVGIITEDRKLARRVRALLERADVALTDSVGWALSTSSAAAALERLLQCVEDDYHHVALLDLLKSPFLKLRDRDRATILQAAYRLERDIIHGENIASGLGRYRRETRRRARRLGWASSETRDLLELLEEIEATTATLKRFVAGPARPPGEILAALRHSMVELGMWERLASDDAGIAVLQQLEEMSLALAGRSLHMAWLDFRTWLGRTLETATFNPPVSGGTVVLTTLMQSHLQRFDALIIAAANDSGLIGVPASTPYFNEGVRHELGLPTFGDHVNVRLFHFRCLLQASPRILFSYAPTTDGGESLPSPWLSLLCAFHRLAYGADFEDDGLNMLVGHPATEIAVREVVPALQVAMPAPNAPLELLPKSYSASRYQTLLACPYRFFATECLRLRAPEEVREILAKNEYGERIHRILELFHHGASDDNVAFPEPITDARRTDAITHLRNLSRREFARDIRDNFLHRGWLHRWLDLVPAYIDWQIARNREWRISDVEVRAAVTRQCRTGSYEIRGRLDRVDHRGVGTGIVDYKTGAVPDARAVAAGEAVQLPLYALLHAQPVERVEYLRLDGEVKSAVVLEGESLRALAQLSGERFDKLVDDLHAGAPLPAWGDEATCGYCEFGPVCRRQLWHEGDRDE